MIISIFPHLLHDVAGGVAMPLAGFEVDFNGDFTDGL